MELQKILIVEDELIISLHFRRMLESMGNYEVKCESYGEKAVELAFEMEPDVIFMDINLKGEMNGIEAAEQILNSDNIPIIFVTAYSDDETIERSKLLNPFGYLNKPMHIHAVKNLMDSLIDYNKNSNQTYEVVKEDGHYGDFYEPLIMSSPHFAHCKEE